VEFALRHQYSLNGCEPGLGKTRIALEFIRRTGNSGLIVGPAFLRGTWEKEAKTLGVTNIRYVNYSMIHKESQKSLSGFSTWIADEFHYIKSPKAIRSVAYYSLLKAVRPKYWLGLSGTPIKNQVSDLWVPLAICSQVPEETPINGLRLTGDLQKYFLFCRYFCNIEVIRKRGGGKVEKFSGVKTEKIPEIKALLDKKYIRYRVSDVLKELPTMTTIEVPLGLKPVPGLEEAFENYLLGNKVDATSKALSARLKAEQTGEYVSELVSNDEAVVVFSDHVDAVREICAKVPGSVNITGATPMHVRQKFVDKFQAGEIPVIVATIGALATGVTLTRARHVVFNDLCWTPSDNFQASKRIHRIGQDNVCFRHIMTGSATDSYIAKTLTAKEETILKVLS